MARRSLGAIRSFPSIADLESMLSAAHYTPAEVSTILALMIDDHDQGRIIFHDSSHPHLRDEFRDLIIRYMPD